MLLLTARWWPSPELSYAQPPVFSSMVQKATGPSRWHVAVPPMVGSHMILPSAQPSASVVLSQDAFRL